MIYNIDEDSDTDLDDPLWDTEDEDDGLDGDDDGSGVDYRSL
jgi:hypothetical protein